MTNNSVCREINYFSKVYIWDLNDNFVGLWNHILSKITHFGRKFSILKVEFTERNIFFPPLWRHPFLPTIFEIGSA